MGFHKAIWLLCSTLNSSIRFHEQVKDPEKRETISLSTNKELSYELKMAKHCRM